MCGMQNVDPEHPAFLTYWTFCDINARNPEESFLPGFGRILIVHFKSVIPEYLTAHSDIFLTCSVCQQTEVAYLDETVRQYMEKEASYELGGLESHDLFLLAISIITPDKGNRAVPECEDALIADGDPVSVPAEVLQDTLRAMEGRFAIDDPLLMIESSSELFEGMGVIEVVDNAGKGEFP